MVETTFELPVIDLGPFLVDPHSSQSLIECQKAAEAMRTYSSCSVRDPRVSETMNAEFLNLLEDYFDQPTVEKLKDARPELAYQVGSTPENVELPRCGRDPQCLAYVESLSPEDRPHGFDQKDPKWRFFWRIGEQPSETQFELLNADPVIPHAFPQWKQQMNSWGSHMLSAVEILAQMLAVGFGFPMDTFKAMLQYGPHLLAPTGSDLNKYGQIGTVLAGFHTDLNFLTIHGKSRFPGLYVWTPQGKKLLVRVRDGCLLVQAVLTTLTNGMTAQAIERQKEEQRPLWRISSTLFSHVASDNTLQPLGKFAETEGAMDKYPPILTGKQVEDELKFISLST